MMVFIILDPKSYIVTFLTCGYFFTILKADFDLNWRSPELVLRVRSNTAVVSASVCLA